MKNEYLMTLSAASYVHACLCVGGMCANVCMRERRERGDGCYDGGLGEESTHTRCGLPLDD